MRTRSARPWLAALLAPILLAGVAAPTQASARCFGAGMSRQDCCCHGASAAPTSPRVKRPCCCEVDVPAAPDAPVQAAKAGGATFAPMFVAVAMQTTLLAMEVATVRVAPPLLAPSIGPPLILLKSSLLI